MLAALMVGCVELPPLPSGPVDSMALPFICYGAGVPLLGGWVVVTGDDFDTYGPSLGSWEACNNGEIVVCLVNADDAVPADDLSHHSTRAHSL